MIFLSLTDLSVYIDLSKCLSYDFFDKILREFCFYLEILGFPKIKTLYIKYEALDCCNNSRLKSFLASLSARFDFIKLDEFTFELHPEEVTLSLLSVLSDFSVSRVSIDINSFSSKFLGIMDNFNAPIKNLNSVVDNIHKFYFDLNIDLNICIPYQEKVHLKNDLEKLLSFSPKHVCLSEFLVDERNYIGHSQDVCFVNDEAKSEDLWFYALNFLESNGYVNYEISNFALKGHESKHNFRYWGLKPYLGLGIGSVSLLICTQDGSPKAVIRNDNNFLGSKESSATFEILSDLDFFICHFITNLGTKNGLNISVLKHRFVYDQEDFFKFIDYLLRLNRSVVFFNDILYLDGHERFKLDLYLRLISEYLVNNCFKVKFKSL
ncbi:HemN-related non-iron pseudo-SAM protein PsgB [Borrelia sp. HM]|uniref:HemN-related non-iron pseudo-SAM protein PsgB n=1 Tax=Borrelia sp. HM TaxID=1882662 RepID=UPI001C777149|nr:HemN-related non-iron pseudo-SAM protein PsgB [Borrelia sp. HM]BCR22066.1 hypothetical protein BKFM_00655 [Borrelia sp. HM]